MVIPLLQVVQAGVDLVQPGVDGCLNCFLGDAVDLAYRADIHRHTLFHMAMRPEDEAPKLWPPDGKSQLIVKDPDAGKD